MKIALMTQPALFNYGGILQAYALHKTINSLGGDCTLLDLDLPIYPYYRRFLSVANRIYCRLFKHEKCEIIPYWKSKRTIRTISTETRKFVEKYINPKTELIEKISPSLDQYDIYIVGSDQVWRKSISLNIENYLFNFVKSNKKKCAYAASFGVDHWEYTPAQTKRIKSLMSNFEFLTVREASAVQMISEHLGLESQQVLDPTLLLNKQEYNNLVTDKKTREGNYIFTYILDETPLKKQVIEKVSNLKGLPIEDIMPKSKLGYFQNSKNHIYAPVEDWLRCYRDCDFVITDSFHGTVFSIIYNKPFIVLHNPSRGNTRMESLLDTFNLKDRLVGSLDGLNDISSQPIDWDSVNNILDTKKNESVKILKKMIK